MSMRFYRLARPKYGSYQEQAQANPLRPIQDMYLPGVICDLCGKTWAGNRRTYLPVGDPELREQLRGRPIPWRNWVMLAEAVRRDVGLAEDAELRPGDVLGTPIAELRTGALSDFSHPFPGHIVVNRRVAEALVDAGMTGFHTVPVDIRAEPGAHVPQELPALYELIVHGTAWREGVDLDRITDCLHCHRHIFPPPHDAAVDVSRWDGSDFFHVDLNSNIVLVTPRVCELFAERGFGNYACEEFPEVYALEQAQLEAFTC